MELLEEKVLDVIRKRIELEERVKALEEKRNALRAEVEELKVVVEAEALKAIAELEAKSSTLEGEVAKLREEKMALELATAVSQAPAERQEEAVESPEKVSSKVVDPIPA